MPTINKTYTVQNLEPSLLSLQFAARAVQDNINYPLTTNYQHPTLAVTSSEDIGDSGNFDIVIDININLEDLSCNKVVSSQDCFTNFRFDYRSGGITNCGPGQPQIGNYFGTNPNYYSLLINTEFSTDGIVWLHPTGTVANGTSLCGNPTNLPDSQVFTTNIPSAQKTWMRHTFSDGIQTVAILDPSQPVGYQTNEIIKLNETQTRLLFVSGGTVVTNYGVNITYTSGIDNQVKTINIPVPPSPALTPHYYVIDDVFKNGTIYRSETPYRADEFFVEFQPEFNCFPQPVNSYIYPFFLGQCPGSTPTTNVGMPVTNYPNFGALSNVEFSDDNIVFNPAVLGNACGVQRYIKNVPQLNMGEIWYGRGVIEGTTLTAVHSSDTNYIYISYIRINDSGTSTIVMRASSATNVNWEYRLEYTDYLNNLFVVNRSNILNSTGIFTFIAPRPKNNTVIRLYPNRGLNVNLYHEYLYKEL